MNKLIQWGLCFAVIGGMSLNVCATPVVAGINENWGSLDSPVGWTAVDLLGSQPETTGVQVSPDTGTSITLTFPNGGFSPYASLSTAKAYYTGDYTGLGTQLGVKFSMTPNITPTNDGWLQFYFASGANVWYAKDLATPLVGGTQIYSFGIGTEQKWNPAIGNNISWLSGFQNVTEIGFTINGPNSGDALQSYTITDLHLTVPEPETYAMILVVLASLGITFRSRLMELAGQVKARIRA